MKTFSILVIAFLFMTSNGYCQSKKSTSDTKSTKSLINKENNVEEFYFTENKVDSTILSKEKIIFTKNDQGRTDIALLILKKDKQFTLAYNIAEIRDSVKNDVTGKYDTRILSTDSRIEGNFECSDSSNEISLILKNGRTFSYSFDFIGDKTIFTKKR
jgi:hypothetical protein